jgi:5-methylcytosine-specific restriction endonuclease McrA
MKLIKTNCVTCNEPFLTTTGKINSGRGKNCSRECCYQSKRKTIVARCTLCNREKEIWPSRIAYLENRGMNFYCSKECSNEGRIESYIESRNGICETKTKNQVRQKGTCKVCNGETSEPNIVYCSNCIPRSLDNNPRWLGGVSLKKGYSAIHENNRRSLKAKSKEQFTEDEWEIVKKVCGYMCLGCLREEPEISLTRDHIIPLSKGGSNGIDNIQPLCKSCNSSKGAKKGEHFNHIKCYNINIYVKSYTTGLC